MDRAMLASIKAERAATLLKKAARKGDIPRGPLEAQLEAAVAATILTAEEAEDVRIAERLREDAIQVDSFSLEAYRQTAFIAAED